MRLVWFTGIAALFLFLYLFWYLSPLHPGAVCLQLTFTPSAFAAVIHAWSPQELNLYRSHFPVDFAFLLCYGAFGWLFTVRTALFASYTPAVRRVIACLLPLAAFFDAAENFLHLWLTEVPRPDVPLAYAISGTSSALKWALSAGFGVAVIYAAVIYAVSRTERSETSVTK